VNKLLRESAAVPGEEENTSEDENDEEWEGIPERPSDEPIGLEEEYIDEDRYTTVTVQSVLVSRDGLEKPAILGELTAEDGVNEAKTAEKSQESRDTRPKKRKKKFRYETKLERQLTERKHKAKNRLKRPT
jgi:ribosomal RNA-processing protein 17